MLSFFRRALSSWLILGLLGLVMIAFIIGGVLSSPQMPGAASTGDTLITIGKTKIRSSEIEERVQQAFQAAQQQNPSATMADFANAGGVERTIDEYISERSVELWGASQGVVASERLIDGDIASIPQFRGPTGRFDPTLMRGMLQQIHKAESDLRADVAGNAIRRQMLIPVAGAARTPNGMVLPYASLMLERRAGLIAVVPDAAIPAGTPPADAEIQAFYRSNIARFTIPERRELRYATFGTSTLTGSFAPSDAEIQAFYTANRAIYAAREKRSFSQIVLPTQAAAAAFAAKVRSGTAFEAAAREAGFAPADIAIADIEKPALIQRANAAVANAAFGAAQGALVGPVQSDFGWHVLKVNSVQTIAARPLATVREEIVTGLTRQKRDEALAAQVAAMQNAIDSGSSFDDLVRSDHLTVQTTPALLPSGAAPDQPDYHAPPEMQLLLRAAQDMEARGDPAVQQLGAGQNYALLSVSRVVAAAPAPLARVRQQVIDAIVAQRRATRAAAIAREIETKVKRGVPMAQAVQETGIPLPAPRPISMQQAEIAQPGREIPRAIELMFRMRQGDTRAVAQEGVGWFVVSLGQVTPGDARTIPNLIGQTRNSFIQVMSSEYAEEFGNAAARALGVTRNAPAIAALRARLAGGR